MRYEPFEIKGLKLEKEYKSTFPVIIQLVQNTKESTYTNFYGTIGDHYNLAYSIELPELLPDDNKNTNRNFVKLRNALNNLKSVKLSKHDLFKDFYVIKITDYSSTSRSIGSYEFLPLVFMKVNDNYEKIPQNRVGLIKNFTSKEAFIIIDKGASNYSFNNLANLANITEDKDDFIVDIYFKRRTIKNTNPADKDKIYEDNYSVSSSIDGNSIIFTITNNSIDGKLSPIDLNRIRFTYDDTYLVNSSVFAKVEVINSAGETIELNRQLTADDYFKFLYGSNYSPVTFAGYEKPQNSFKVKYTLLTEFLPLSTDKNENEYKKFKIVLSENTPWYYQYSSKQEGFKKENFFKENLNKNNAIYWKTNGKLCRLLISNIEDTNDALYEVFPAYDNYERFVDVISVSGDITKFDIHKYLLKQKVFNYDSAGFLEIFNKHRDENNNADGSYVKSANTTVTDDSFISFRFSNEYNDKILDKSIVPYGDEVSSKGNGGLKENIIPNSFVKNVNGKNICCGLFGDPTLNLLSQESITSTTDNILYPLDGDNPRVQKIITDKEIRSYKNNNGFINIGFATKADSGNESSDFRKDTDNTYSIAVNNIRKKHAATINGIYNKFHTLQEGISGIKTKLKARIPDPKDIVYKTASTDGITYTNSPTTYFTKYFIIKPINSSTETSPIEKFDIEITDSSKRIIKREYACNIDDYGYYILVPYCIIKTAVTDTDKLKRSGSGYIESESSESSLGNTFTIKCYKNLTNEAIGFYYKEGL